MTTPLLALAPSTSSYTYPKISEPSPFNSNTEVGTGTYEKLEVMEATKTYFGVGHGVGEELAADVWVNKYALTWPEMLQAIPVVLS